MATYSIVAEERGDPGTWRKAHLIKGRPAKKLVGALPLCDNGPAEEWTRIEEYGSPGGADLEERLCQTCKRAHAKLEADVDVDVGDEPGEGDE